GRINYAYNDKYLVSASFRRDGSSVFGQNTKYGNFPSISAGWNVAKEDFLKDNKLINTLKFRASYGLTGSENFNVGNDVINAWPYLSLLEPTNAVVDGNITNGFSPLNIANNELQWESSKEYTLGVDFGFLRNKILGSLNYYKRTSDNLLLENPVSYVTGFDFGIVNLGEVVNSGFEFDITTKNINSANFSWSSTFVASTNKNELTAFGDSNGALLEDIYGRNSQWINLVGNPISSFYGFVVDKDLPNEYWTSPYFPINGESQDVIVKDLNGDGIITNEDKTILGDPYPELIWSLTNDFRYKGFDFSIMIQGSHGAEVRNVGDEYFYSQFNGATISPAQVVSDGIVSDASFIQARVVTNDIVQSAGYFSLRNINIGYNMPEKYIAKIGITGFRIYATGQNLLYITDKGYTGFNPEFIDDNNPRAYGAQRAGTPLFRTTSIGVNINF
uniref:TonB-dependent receptor domain-containing protein n=1 Tax=Flavobacterium sp. TaxID=239 RepID=UPI00404B4592